MIITYAYQAELRDYIAASGKPWTIENGVVKFNQPVVDSNEIPSHRLIKETLTYATELERIV